MKTREEIHSWLKERLAKVTGRGVDEIGTSRPFTDYGLDSIMIVTLAVDLEDWLLVSLDATVFWEHPSIEKLTEWLLSEKLQPQK